MKKENEILILDYDQWRCGKDGKHHLGEGTTLLRNSEGYECCLDQFTQQLVEIDDRYLRVGSPSATTMLIPGLTKESPVFASVLNTMLSREAAEINDNESTTPDTKIRKLTKLFSKHGYDIVVLK